MPAPDETARDRTELGQKVKATRESARESIDTAAKRAGISPVTWARVERGEVVKPITYSAVDVGMGWAAGSAVAYLRDRTEPRPLASSTLPSPLVYRIRTVYDSNLPDQVKLDIIMEWIEAAANQLADPPSPVSTESGGEDTRMA